MIQNLILSIGLSFAIGLNGAKDNHDNFINNDTPNNVVYDDEGYEITLSTNEVNNYTWDNLATYLYNTGAPNNFSLVYNNVNYSYIDTDEGAYQYVNNQDYIYFVIEYSTFNDAYGGHFVNYQFALEQNTFEYSVSITTNQTYYNAIKTAIELDIAANKTQPSMGNTIINAIKSGLGLIGDLASQLLLGFSTLFWANNALTPFGTFALVMLGVAITMAVVSLVLNIIRGNTGA